MYIAKASFACTRFIISPTASSSVLPARSELQNGHFSLFPDFQEEYWHPAQMLFPQHG
jgi:hypothetical protein